MFKYLIEHGANVNAKIDNGGTALKLAALYGNSPNSFQVKIYTELTLR